MIQSLHTHSTLCDGKHTPEEMVISAIEKGLKSFGFSGHSHIEGELWCLRDLDGYISEINALKEKYKHKIEIFLGIEMDISNKIDTTPFDYVISSAHCVLKDGKRLWADYSKDEIIKVVNEYFNGDFYAYISEYYEEVFNASKYGDILGHFDLVTKYNGKNELFDENSEKYLKICYKNLEKCAESNIIFEINSGAIERGVRDVIYPAPYLLDKMRELGIKIIITADAHNKDAIDFYYEKSVKILKEHGFTHQMMLTKDGFIEVPL